MLVCVAANPSIDKLFVVGELVPGEIHRPAQLVARPGGKGLNVARAAHALGAEVLAVALLAGHAGRWVEAELEREGVRVAAVAGAGETRSCLSVLARHDGATTEFYEAGDPPGAERFAALADRAAEEAGRARWVALSGSLPPGVAPAVAADLVRRASAAGARVAVDQAGPVLGAALAAGPDLVKVNGAEAAELTGEEDPARAAAALRDRAGGRAVVVVTLGADGAVLLAGGPPLRAGLAARGDFPTGSGDAFLGGMLAAADAGAGWEAAFAAGLGAATANALVPGVGSLDPATARALGREARGALTAA